MDPFRYHFAISGVETNVLLPPLVAFIISFFTSMVGMSGAFLILPFQMSVLGFTSPSVSATNFIYNIVSIPSGAYRYMKEGRMAWPIVLVVVIGTIPGIWLGYYLRVLALPDPAVFKRFVGVVLALLGIKMLYEAIHPASRGKGSGENGEPAQPARAAAVIREISFSLRRAVFEFSGRCFSYPPLMLLLLALVVGVIGGAYGIGGGAIIAPFMIAVFRLPVYAVAGAALMATFAASVAGVSFYSVLTPPAGMTVAPDWLLGTLFGLGGFAGMYLGARTQKHVPERIMKFLLSLLILALGGDYTLG